MIRTVAIVVQRASSRLHMRGPGTGATLARDLGADAVRVPLSILS
jgi:hypothetical protein